MPETHLNIKLNIIGIHGIIIFYYTFLYNLLLSAGALQEGESFSITY